MESYEIDVIKIEKLKAMRRYRTFRKIATAVKTLEIFIGIVIVSWSISSVSAHLPTVLEFAGKFLRRISSLLFSPHFVFVLGNAIVITLFAKSGDRNSSPPSTENVSVAAADDVLPGEVAVEEKAYEEEKSGVGETVTETVIAPAEEEEQVKRESEKKTYERTRSALEMVIVETKEKKELRRSVTDPRRSSVGVRKSPAVRRMHEVDELSSDEFRRKVEAFIEKQQRLLRAESKSVVVFNDSRCNSL